MMMVGAIGAYSGTNTIVSSIRAALNFSGAAVRDEPLERCRP